MTFLDKAGLTRVGEYINTNFSNDRARITAVEEHPLMQTGDQTLTILPEDFSDLPQVSGDYSGTREFESNFEGTYVSVSSEAISAWASQPSGTSNTARFYFQGNNSFTVDQLLELKNKSEGGFSYHDGETNPYYSYSNLNENTNEGNKIYLKQLQNDNFLIYLSNNNVYIPVLIQINTPGEINISFNSHTENINFQNIGTYILKIDSVVTDGSQELNFSIYAEDYTIPYSVENAVTMIKIADDTNFLQGSIYKGTIKEKDTPSVLYTIDLSETLLEEEDDCTFITYQEPENNDKIFLGIYVDKPQTLNVLGVNLTFSEPGVYLFSTFKGMFKEDPTVSAFNIQSITLNQFKQIPEKFIEDSLDEIKSHPLYATGGSTKVITPEDIKDLDTISANMWNSQHEDADYTGTPILASSSVTEAFGAATVGFYKQSDYEGSYNDYIDCTDTISMQIYMDNNETQFSFKGATSFNEASSVRDLYIENCSNNNFALIGKMSSEVALPLIIFVNTSGTVTVNGYRAGSNIPVELTFSENGVYTVKMGNGQGAEMYVDTWPTVNYIEGFLKLFKGYSETELKENCVYKASFDEDEDGVNDHIINMELGKNTTTPEENGTKYIFCDDFSGIFLGVIFEEIGEQPLGEEWTVNVPSPGTYFIYEVCESDDFSNIWSFESLTINDFTEIPERFIKTSLNEIQEEINDIKEHPLLQTGGNNVTITPDDIESLDTFSVNGKYEASHTCDFTGTPISLSAQAIEDINAGSFAFYKQSNFEGSYDFYKNQNITIPIYFLTDTIDLLFNGATKLSDTTLSNGMGCYIEKEKGTKNFIFYMIFGVGTEAQPMLVFINDPGTIEFNATHESKTVSFNATFSEKGVYATKATTTSSSDIYLSTWPRYYLVENAASFFKAYDTLKLKEGNYKAHVSFDGDEDLDLDLIKDCTLVTTGDTPGIKASGDTFVAYYFAESGSQEFMDTTATVPSPGMYFWYEYYETPEHTTNLWEFGSLTFNNFIKIPEEFIPESADMNEFRQKVEEHPLYPVGEETITLTAADLEDVDEAVVTIEQLQGSTWDSAEYYNNLTPITSTSLETVVSKFELPFPATGAFYKVNEDTMTYNQATTVSQTSSFQISLFGESSSLEWGTLQPSESSSGHTAIQDLNNDNFAIFVNDGNSVIPYLIYINSAGNVTVPFYISTNENPTALTMSAEINFPSTGIYSILLTGEIDNNTAYLHPYQYYTYTSFSPMKFKKVSSEIELNGYFEYNAEVPFKNFPINWTSDHMDEVDLYDSLIPNVTAIALKAIEGFMLAIICPNEGSFTDEENTTLRVPSPGTYAATYLDMEHHGASDINFISVTTKKITQINEKYIPEDLSVIDWNKNEGSRRIDNKPFYEIETQTSTPEDLENNATVYYNKTEIYENIQLTVSNNLYKDATDSVECPSEMASVIGINNNITPTYYKIGTIDQYGYQNISREELAMALHQADSNNTYDFKVNKYEVGSDTIANTTLVPVDGYQVQDFKDWINTNTLFIQDYNNNNLAIVQAHSSLINIGFPYIIIVNTPSSIKIPIQTYYSQEQGTIDSTNYYTMNFSSSGVYAIRFSHDDKIYLIDSVPTLMRTKLIAKKFSEESDFSNVKINFSFRTSQVQSTFEETSFTTFNLIPNKLIKIQPISTSTSAQNGVNDVGFGYIVKEPSNYSDVKTKNVVFPEIGCYCVLKASIFAPRGYFSQYNLNFISYPVTKKIESKFIPTLDWNTIDGVEDIISNKPFGKNYIFKNIPLSSSSSNTAQKYTTIFYVNNEKMSEGALYLIGNYVNKNNKDLFIGKKIIITQEVKNENNEILSKKDTEFICSEIQVNDDNNLYQADYAISLHGTSSQGVTYDSPYIYFAKKLNNKTTSSDGGYSYSIEYNCPNSGAYTDIYLNESSYRAKKLPVLENQIIEADNVDFSEYLEYKNQDTSLKAIFKRVSPEVLQLKRSIESSSVTTDLSLSIISSNSTIFKTFKTEGNIRNNVLNGTLSGAYGSPLSELYLRQYGNEQTILGTKPATIYGYDDLEIGAPVLLYIPEDNTTIPIEIYNNTINDSTISFSNVQTIEKTFPKKGTYILSLDFDNTTYDLLEYLKLEYFEELKYISYIEPIYETKALAAEYMPYCKRTEITPTFTNVSPSTSTTQVFHEIDHVHLRTSHTGWSYGQNQNNPDIIWTVTDADGLFDDSKFTIPSGGSTPQYLTSAMVYADNKPYLATFALIKTGTGAYSLQLEELTGALGQETSTTIQPGIIDIYVPAPIE